MRKGNIVLMEDTEQYALEAGGNAFPEKPFAKKQLLAIIETLLKFSTGTF